MGIPQTQVVRASAWTRETKPEGLNFLFPHKIGLEYQVWVLFESRYWKRAKFMAAS